jgi:signal transduction histidine kinase
MRRATARHAALIGDTIADLDAVLGMFASITRISEIETRASKGAFRELNLVDIAGEVVEQVATCVSLAGDREVKVTGDRDLLFDAIANLVDNAVKHGRTRGQVTVTCATRQGAAVMVVEAAARFRRCLRHDLACFRRSARRRDAWPSPRARRGSRSSRPESLA